VTGALLFTKKPPPRGARAVTAFYAHTLTTKEVMTRVDPDRLTGGYVRRKNPPGDEAGGFFSPMLGARAGSLLVAKQAQDIARDWLRFNVKPRVDDVLHFAKDCPRISRVVGQLRS
jgi:hypothetical protein